MNWWKREQDTEELVESGREALAELHLAANRLSRFVEQLEALVADERASRRLDRGDPNRA